MTYFDAIFQGLIQGLTEFLPVSSSGHLSLVQYFTGQGGESGALFSILLHLGTLIAVVAAFYKTILQLILETFDMIADMFKGKFSFKHMKPTRKLIWLILLSLVPLVFFVFIKDFYQGISTDKDITVEGVCFIITGSLLFMADSCATGRKRAKDMRWKDALTIGIVQGIAPLPGISRSGSTVSMGLILGLEKQFAVTFSFIMGIPAVVGAALLDFKDISASVSGENSMVLITGMIIAAVTGFLAIKMVQWLVKYNKFKYFAWYTVILGVITVGVGIFELCSNNMLASLVK